MSTDEVAGLAENLGVSTFRIVEEPDAYVTHVLNEGSTFFEFYFGDTGLETVRRGATKGLTTGTTYEPRVNLCTGEQTGSLLLKLTGPPELGGAQIYVDDKPRGRLSMGPGCQMHIGLTSGPHELRVEQEGYAPIEMAVNYGPYERRDEIALPLPEFLNDGSSP